MNRHRHFLRACTVTCLLLASLAVLPPAFAQDAAPAPAYRIERITVQGAQREAAHNIAADETRLREGQTYDQNQLDQAIYRVRRLPWVLAADYQLRQGSAPGAYELVITIHNDTAVRLVVDGVGIFDGDVPEEEDDGFNSLVSGEVQARSFVGERGMAFASASKSERVDPIGQAGYTQYGLFGAGSSATVTAGRLFSGDEEGVESDDIFAGLAVALPVSPNNTVRLSLNWSRSDFEAATFERQVSFHSPAVQWIYDTTDDPLFALRGLQVIGAASYERTEEEIGGERSDSSDSFTLTAGAVRYVPLTASQSLGFTLVRTYQEVVEDEPEANGGTLAAGIGHFANLWDTEVSGWRGRLRWENRLVYTREETDGTTFHAENFVDLSSGLVFRTNWGIVRTSLAYQETF
jgi:outer membrane protein assembly factor BamA